MIVAIASQLFQDLIPVGLISRIDYFSTTLLLTPLVSVLGAKKPGVRFWNYFVVIPMLLMLNWPVIVQGVGTHGIQVLNLEPPALMGIFVVLLMVLGNYFGTVFTLPAILYCCGVLISLTPSSQSLPQISEFPAMAHCLSSLLFVGALFSSRRRYYVSQRDRAGYDRIWLDFRDWFGILWARRVMERLNQTADKEEWSARLTLEGIQWDSEQSLECRKQTQEKLDHALRWILRRFVEESWIDDRLEETATVS